MWLPTHPAFRQQRADIEKVLETEKPKPTEGDIEALQPLAKKIASRSPSIFWEGKDWVSDAKVKSDDFLVFEMER